MMGEVRRKRPWEEKQSEPENNVFEKFLQQLILCTVILIGILIALHRNNNSELKQLISVQLSKSIQLQEIYSLVDEVKDKVSHYID
ncbi:MAG: hypothetical protein K0S30_269 [Clostridia bacterium]|jgi:hypothetical protein|nr:hypothetical protein [Clostridia bacterium]